MRGLCQQVNPQNLNDISAIISLFRPACLKNDFHKLYITNKNG
jgi:DNA polymerase III alpha subunit